MTFFDNFEEASEPRERRQGSGFSPQDMINNFFGGSSGMGGFFNQAFAEEADELSPRDDRRERRRRRRQRNDPFGLFGDFDFPSIFNDNQFENFGGVFHNSFNPGDFMNNFNQNFRSSSNFEDLLDHIMRMQQAPTNPAARDVVDKLPIIVVEGKHCKKVEGKEELEPPTCPVCIEEISVGKEAMFMPCGHTYHPDCLKPWLKDHNTCPTCRMELPSEN